MCCGRAEPMWLHPSSGSTLSPKPKIKVSELILHSLVMYKSQFCSFQRHRSEYHHGRWYGISKGDRRCSVLILIMSPPFASDSLGLLNCILRPFPLYTAGSHVCTLVCSCMCVRVHAHSNFPLRAISGIWNFSKVQQREIWIRSDM